MLMRFCGNHPHWERLKHLTRGNPGTLKPLPGVVSRRGAQQAASPFSVLARAVDRIQFDHLLSGRLALVGAFGYDLLLQFDPIERKLPRHDVKDLHLYLCDDIYFMDRKKERIERYQFFDFTRSEHKHARD